MDWSKTKTIFIIVFSILNVFLYTVYVNNYNEEQDLEIIGESSLESDLKTANITLNKLPDTIEKTSYMSGKTKQFENKDLEDLPKNQILTIRDNTIVESTLKNPMKLEGITKKTLTDFIRKMTYNGESYVLWRIDEEKREATFFQITDDRIVFYNQSAAIKVHWSTKNAVTSYEQTMFSTLKPVGEKSSLIKSNQAVKTIFEKGYLKDDTVVTSAELGYSTLVPLTETQVLSPTWHIQTSMPNGGKDKIDVDFFVNAVDAQVLEIEKNIEFENKDTVELEYKTQNDEK